MRIGPRLVAVLVLVLVVHPSLLGCSTGTPDLGPPSSPPGPRHARSIPIWVEVPSITAWSTLISLGLNPDRTLQVPPVTQPLQAGWYQHGPTPGEPGPAVILGHVDGNHRKGIFWRLREVKPGDPIAIGRQDGTTLTFIANKTEQVAKNTFPTDAVYGDTPGPELRLITCGGAFDTATRTYLDNIVVYATLAPT